MSVKRTNGSGQRPAVISCGRLPDHPRASRQPPAPAAQQPVAAVPTPAVPAADLARGKGRRRGPVKSVLLSWLQNGHNRRGYSPAQILEGTGLDAAQVSSCLIRELASGTVCRPAAGRWAYRRPDVLASTQLVLIDGTQLVRVDLVRGTGETILHAQDQQLAQKLLRALPATGI